MKTLPFHRSLIFWMMAFLVLHSAHLTAQVPRLINYQGRVVVGSVNFDGSGVFKFALVNADGTTTYWSNDGTSIAGSEPTTGVTLTVTKGLYSVLLGDAALANMSVLPATVFTNDPVRLRVWFDDGVTGPQQLVPDQRMSAVGYALVAADVDDGAITEAKLAPGAVTSANIAAGTIDGTHIAAGALDFSHLLVTSPPGPGQVLSYDGSDLSWITPGGGSGPWQLNGTSAFYNAGLVGIGTNLPNHSLSIAGGPAWTSYSWGGAMELTNGSAIGWRANAGGQRFGIGQSTGGLYFFRTASDPGTTGSPASYDMYINDSGNVVMSGGGTGIFTVGSPNGESGLSIQRGGNRADLRFDGSAMKLVAGTGSGPPSSLGGLAVNTAGHVGIGTTTPSGALHVASGGLAVTGASSPYSGAGSGVFIESGGSGGNVFAFNYSSSTARNLLLNAPGGNVGIGAPSPTAKLEVALGGTGYSSPPAIRATNSPGIAGEFTGRVTISESLLVSLSTTIGSNLSVSGTISKGGGSFKIDHPLDPANKYLSHSFVESPDMMNVYNGNIALDASGEAVVVLPEWFEALNKEFRYQLTCIGGFAPVFIAEEIGDHRFKIAGGKPGLKISWQVTGIRKDAWANANRIPVEQDKPDKELGSYLHPTLFGQPAEKSVERLRASEELPAEK